MRVNNKANTTGSDGTIDDTSLSPQSSKEAGSSTAQEKAALINQLGEVATAVGALTNASGNQDGEVSNNSNSSIDENTNSESEVDSSSQTPSITIEPFGPNQVQFTFNSKVMVIDFIPFKCMMDLMQQRLIQTETNIDLSKTMSASYIGLTTDANGTITGYNANSDLTKMLMTAITSQGDYQAQQTIIDGTKDMAQGLTTIGGVFITEAVTGNSNKEEQQVKKIQNAIDGLDSVPPAPTTVGDDGVARNNRQPTPDVTKAIKKLMGTNGLNFTESGTHFGSKEEPFDTLPTTKIKKYTKLVDEGEILVPGTETLDAQGNKVTNSGITVKNAIANASEPERDAIRADWSAQLKQANKVLENRKTNMATQRTGYQNTVSAASQAIGGAISLAKAALQQEQAIQQAIQTAGQSATTTAQDLISTTKQTATASQQSIQEAAKELDAMIQGISQRRV